MDSSSDDFESGMREVEHLRAGRRYDDILKLCSALIQRFPIEFEPYYRRAHAHALLDARSAAILDLGEAISRKPDEPALYFFRGRWRIEEGLLSDGLDDLAEAVRLEALLDSAYYLSAARLSRVVGLFLLGDFSRAVTELGYPGVGESTYLAGRLWTIAKVKEAIAQARTRSK